MAKPRHYYTLLERTSPDVPWGIQFGSFDKSDVQVELHEFMRNGTKRSDLMILRTEGSRQSLIEAAVDTLNGKV
jgi:hypothetical protein